MEIRSHLCSSILTAKSFTKHQTRFQIQVLKNFTSTMSLHLHADWSDVLPEESTCERKRKRQSKKMEKIATRSIMKPNSEDERNRGMEINVYLSLIVRHARGLGSYAEMEQAGSIAKPKQVKALYDEVARILPALEYCLAEPGNIEPLREMNKLTLEAKIVYDWLLLKNKSKIRMDMGCYVKQECKRCHKNAMYNRWTRKIVSLDEFQNALVWNHKGKIWGMPGEAKKQV